MGQKAKDTKHSTWCFVRFGLFYFKVWRTKYNIISIVIDDNNSSVALFFKIGKLSVSTQEGRLRDGTYDKLYSYGGRGFSVLRSDTMERIYDSGSIVEESHAMQYPKLFNSYAKSSVNITDTQDSRSDSKVR